jgi:S-adenosylmethionine synthetase
MVETFGTERGVTADQIADAVRSVFDLRPAAILRDLDLRRPIYRATAAYGHFGRDTFSWEQTDRVDALRAAVGLAAVTA